MIRVDTQIYIGFLRGFSGGLENFLGVILDDFILLTVSGADTFQIKPTNQLHNTWSHDERYATQVWLVGWYISGDLLIDLLV